VASALKKLLKNDELAMGSEFMLYILVGVWADRYARHVYSPHKAASAADMYVRSFVRSTSTGR
jgi:hypothetical protein